MIAGRSCSSGAVPASASWSSPGHGLPDGAAPAGGRVLPDHRPPQARLLADVPEDGDHPGLLRGLVRAAGVRGQNAVAGAAPGRDAGPGHGGHRLQHPARRRAPGLLRAPLGQPADGLDAGPDRRQLLHAGDGSTPSSTTCTSTSPATTTTSTSGLLGRFSPHQKRRWYHRWQHLYLWPFYGLLADEDAAGRRLPVHHHRPAGPAPRAAPAGWELVNFIVGKAVFFAWAFVDPDAVPPGLGRAVLLRWWPRWCWAWSMVLVFVMPHLWPRPSSRCPARTPGAMDTPLGRPPGAGDGGLRPQQPRC